MLNLYYVEPPREYHLFAASFLKLSRASGFIAELEAEIAAYIASDPVPAEFDASTDPPQIKFSIRPAGLVPGAIIGDVVHNLRTALDLMASELARLNEKSDKNVYFPFSDGKDTFANAIKKRNFHYAGEDAVKLIEQFAPYRGGNEALRAIHDLDIQDKHTALIAMAHLPTIEFSATYDVTDPAGTGKATADVSGMKVIFPKESPLFEREIIPTLKEFVELVDGIIKAFSGMILKRLSRQV